MIRLIPLILFFAFCFVVVWLVSKFQKEEYEDEVNDWVGNDCDEGTFSSKEGRGAIDGIPFTYGYTDTHETDDNRDSFSVSIESPTGKEFGIRRETVCDRRFKARNFSVEVQTGDDVFDKRFYLSSDEPEFLLRTLASEERRAAITKVMDCGFTTIYHTGQRLRAEMLPFIAATRTRGGSPLKEALPALAEIANGLPEDNDAVAGKVRRPRSIRREDLLLIASALPIIPAFACMMFNPQVVAPVTFFFVSLLVSLPLAAVFIWVAAIMLKGHSRSHRQLGAVAPVAASCMIFAGFLCGVQLNARLDRSGADERILKIIEKRVEGHRDEWYDYCLIVDSWYEDGETVKLKVPYDIYGRVGARAKVSVKPGAFGFDWIESVIPAD
jgi:hypothetical protein